MQYAIIAKEEQRLIGDCAVKIESADPTQVTIGITISHLEQKKGYAKEVMTGLLDFLFREKDFRRVVEIVDEANIASIALLESLSFRKEGYFLENGFYKGKWCNEYQYALLRREWKAKGS